MSAIAADLLLAEHGPALRNFLGARCRDAELTRDLMQEVALRLVGAGPRLSVNGNARAYLFRIAANVWRDYVRRDLVRRRAAAELAREGPRLSGPPDQAVLARELQDAAARAIAALPRAQREVVELRHRAGLKFKEIAERLHRPLGTVLTQMHAALERIATALEEYR